MISQDEIDAVLRLKQEAEAVMNNPHFQQMIADAQRVIRSVEIPKFPPDFYEAQERATKHIAEFEAQRRLIEQPSYMSVLSPEAMRSIMCPGPRPRRHVVEDEPLPARTIVRPVLKRRIGFLS